MRLLNKTAQGIYALLSRGKDILPQNVKSDLERLHPGQENQVVYRNYTVAKIEKSLLIFLIGSVLAGGLALRAAQEKVISDNSLEREDVLGEEQMVEVETMIGGQRQRFEVLVVPTQLTKEEADACYEVFNNELPSLILGENSSLQEISADLNLSDQYEGYPFWVEWRSNTPGVIDSSGMVYASDVEQTMTLYALVSYGEWEWESRFEVKVLPRVYTPEQAKRMQMEKELLLSQENTKTDTQWILPDSWEGQNITWSKVVEDNSLLLWMGAIIVSIVVYFLGDKDLHQQIEKRKEQMKAEYPDVVHKLVLYLGAGMTLQGAFQRIAAEYEERKDSGGGGEPAYEEIQYTCRELRAGVSESLAYERFGRRTGLQEYIRLSTLMAQNLKKGNSSLLTRLEEEAEHAMAERIGAGRKLGEEASTKLLLPMVMMLAVVMVMVMLPAFGSMGM